jgi:hypothetical protein
MHTTTRPSNANRKCPECRRAKPDNRPPATMPHAEQTGTRYKTEEANKNVKWNEDEQPNRNDEYDMTMLTKMGAT